ncbi:hypothetical protein T484DRAFT_1969267 [Baffinella frigidus]|nr:hypothetical protein T484DRAFT_1969267 [Cryptophyta sp. CCMP2293]
MLDGYINYGAGDFDGEGSGHDFYGVRPPPPAEAETRDCSKGGVTLVNGVSGGQRTCGIRGTSSSGACRMLRHKVGVGMEAECWAPMRRSWFWVLRGLPRVVGALQHTVSLVQNAPLHVQDVSCVSSCLGGCFAGMALGRGRSSEEPRFAGQERDRAAWAGQCCERRYRFGARRGMANADFGVRSAREYSPYAPCGGILISFSLLSADPLHAAFRLRQLVRRRPLAHVLRLPPAVSNCRYAPIHLKTVASW